MEPTLPYKNSILFVAMVFAMLLGASAALAQTSSFTYQGRLTDGGTGANGNYDLQFALWDSLTSGAQVGSTQTLNTVAVSNGVFTVSLDFGANAFTGASRFLEISARPSGGGSFTLLSPRQQITSTPYAVRSLNASSADSVLASGVPSGSGNYIQNTTSTQSISNFNITGNGTAGGTLSGAVVNATTQYDLNGNRILSNPGFFNLFAGTGAGAANTTGDDNSFFGAFAGQQNTTGDGNTLVGGFAGKVNTTGRLNSFFGDRVGFANTKGFQNSFFGFAAGDNNTEGNFDAFFGESAGSANTMGSDNAFVGTESGRLNTMGSDNAFFGTATGLGNTSGNFNTLIGTFADVLSGPILVIDNATAIGARAEVDASNSLVLGSINGVNFATADTKVGIGTTAPKQRLHVKGQGLFTADTATFDPGDSAGPAIRIGYDSSGDYGYINANNTGVTSKNLALQPNGSQGNVGIGTTTPQAKLHVIGSLIVSNDVQIGVLRSGGTTQLCRNASDQIATCNSSSLRYKTNVATFAGGMNIINRLRPISFTWKQDGSKDIGFGAEEVEKVAPLFTFRNDKGEIEGVRYDRLGVVFVNAFKEQQAQIAVLQKVNSALNARLHKVETALRKKSSRARHR